MTLDDLLRQAAAPPYALTFDHARHGHFGTFTHFRIEANRIFITASDGCADRQARAHPGDLVTSPATGRKVRSTLERLDFDSEESEKWRLSLGKFIGTIMFGKRNTAGQYDWLLANFPDHYTLWVRKTQHPPIYNREKKPRQDIYLHGAPVSVTNSFRSPEEFARHAMWLMDGQPRDEEGHTRCVCKYCKRDGKHRLGDQKIVTGELSSLRKAILRGQPRRSESGGDKAEMGSRSDPVEREGK
ncbi:hypothetical protein K488DRAFT_74210 [Vararia minispora EC-137]|uniref:Uncharacterized protein n=1 Tax=Vararia minispora EC-137 TaxID=1314806 RepID=A0ACB8Q834_9AGAM|nr:hypothetical protein K488DRAFT_74210 [Vararia minispora EC-137]